MKKIKLSIEGLNQKYGEKKILKNIDLEIYEGETVVILGSSGCGKTSLLKSIAGLIPIDNGKIYLDDRAIETLPPQERRATMIFQNYALFPHMSVRENLEYGLKVKRMGKEEIFRKTGEILNLLKLEGLDDRPVGQLSGGQQQRVAIGRALIVEPSVLLFDEPLSNLDENLRKSMRRDIKQILRNGNCTSLYVTHDQNEAIAMADRVVVMKDGEIEQISPPSVLYSKPVNENVARFLGFRNIFPAEIQGRKIYLADRQIIPSPHLPGQAVLILIRPEEIAFLGEDESDKIIFKNQILFTGVVTDVELLIAIISYTVATELGEIHVSVLNRSGTESPEIGDEVILAVNPAAFHYFPDQHREDRTL